MDCIFCRIVAKEIPVGIFAENEGAIIFQDRSPAAAQHFLVVSKLHSDDITKAPNFVTNQVLALASDYAAKNLPNGFRLIINTGVDAGQTVKHFHVHLLGGEKLKDI